MKIKYIIVPTILFLTSCSLTNQKLSQVINQDPLVSHSGDLSATGIQTYTGLVKTPSIINSVSVGLDETKDVNLILNENKGELKINYGTGARVKVHFTSEGTKTLKVSLLTPGDVNGNIRVSQIIFPDGTADGPFGKDMNYSLTQSGSYQLILFANMMAGDPWSGEVDLSLELK